MDAYDAGAWQDFAVAAVGACAALAGLIFVAVSINLARILEFPELPGRAARTLVLLLSLLVAGLLVLVPGQPDRALALEVGATGLVLAGAALPPLVRSRTSPRWRLVVATVVVLVPALALVACAATLLAGAGGGLYWLAAATVLGLAGATTNAWVLLVEILR
ncbi:MAG TPA: hypothetical protein VFG13_04510 [Blastococcus sp.]|nr:hypothetical protein [Blastococcus sp.]